MSQAIAIVRQKFPKVEHVVDAEEPQQIEVTQKDIGKGVVKNHRECAFSQACKRTMAVEGVVTSLTMVYLINGKEAVRYRLPESVSREVVSFDRKGGWSPGVYQLLVPDKHHRLGVGRRPPATLKGRKKGKRPTPVHRTENVRTILGHKDIS